MQYPTLHFSIVLLELPFLFSFNLREYKPGAFIELLGSWVSCEKQNLPNLSSLSFQSHPTDTSLGWGERCKEVIHYRCAINSFLILQISPNLYNFPSSYYLALQIISSYIRLYPNDCNDIFILLS